MIASAAVQLADRRAQERLLVPPTRSLPVTISPSREALMFPTLTSAQIAQIQAHGVVRSIAPGDILIQDGDAVVPVFVVKSGEIEIIRPSMTGDTLVAVHHAGG